MKGSEGPGNLPFNLLNSRSNTPSLSQGDLMPLRINLEIQSLPGGRALAAGRGFLERNR